MEIGQSARRHGIRDDEILHALRNAVSSEEIIDEEGPQRVLYLGSDRAGNLLEIVVLEFDDGDSMAIHAMRMRPKYAHLLSPGEKP